MLLVKSHTGEKRKAQAAKSQKKQLVEEVKFLRSQGNGQASNKEGISCVQSARSSSSLGTERGSQKGENKQEPKSELR
ncbi:AAEL002205-PA [Aedes aegypti]|uniref:AAEL002205-PA n=1 Tax=Aedes aegypti TaxID=7159 RepID=Q17IV8_AEDAE|nr:AAEL002205-PA [Aedes aegypti]